MITKNQLIEKLRDKDYRDAYVAEAVDTTPAIQVRIMRKERDWSQSELAAAAEMAQARVSQIENPDYGRLTLATLKRLASAFDVALMVRFVPFSELIKWTTEFDDHVFYLPTFDEELAPKPGIIPLTLR